MKVSKISAALVGLLLATFGVITTTSFAQAADSTLKDWVCKYVGTPGVDERLKTGNDGLVWVATDFPQGSYFNDSQNDSYVLLADVPQDPAPNASECPPPRGPANPDAKVTVVVTYGPIVCNATTYVKTTTTTTSTQTYSLVDGEWVLSAPVITPSVVDEPVAIPVDQLVADQSTNLDGACYVPPTVAPSAEKCVAADASTEQVLVTPASDTTVVDKEAWTETIPATQGSWTDLVWYVHTGEWNLQGPPAVDDGHWQVTAAEPNGVHEFALHTPNVPYSVDNANGRSDWFLWTATFVPGIPEHTVDHPAETHVVHVDAVYQTVDHPAVVCPTSTATKSEVLAAEPNVTPTPTRQVAAVPAGAVSTGDGSTAALASTGANPLPWSLAALLLIASGSLLLPKVRRVVFRH